jgi:hypothetical protein
MSSIHGRDLSPEEMAQLVAEFVNGANEGDIENFALYLTERVHRTNQQGVMGLFVRCIEKWARLSSGEFDLRNQATVDLCKKMIEATGDIYDRFLPRV